MASKKYTMQEMADVLGVNKTSIYRYLKENKIVPVDKSNTPFLYSATAFNKLKKHFNPSNDRDKVINNDDSIAIATLRQQVSELQSEIKAEKQRADKELEAKDNQIAALHKLMDQNQQLLLNTQAENKRLLALQAPAESSQNVQEGKFNDTNTSANTNKKTLSKGRTEPNNGNTKWWHFWK